MMRSVFCGTALLATVAFSGQALAYCQTTSCLPSVTCTQDPTQCCILDRNGCDTNGIVITWPSMCASFSIHEGGSPLRGITADELETAVEKAFFDWTSADCGFGTPAIRFESFGMVECDETEVNNISSGPNANIWTFRDAEWPHSSLDDNGSQVNSSALALTTVTFNYKTGELLDADVELNSAQGEFTNRDTDVRIDLQAIVEHEAGHFLGLDHTNDSTATMAPGYVPRTTDQRTLALDDEAGVCASYPQGRPTSSQSCDPNGTYSPQCGGGGCSVAGGPGAGGPGARTPGGTLLVFGAGLLLALAAQARRGRKEPAKVRARRRR